MIRLKNLLNEDSVKSTEITWNGKKYYVQSDYRGLKNIFAFEDPELKKVAKHPKGGTLIFSVQDIEYSLKK